MARRPAYRTGWRKVIASIRGEVEFVDADAVIVSVGGVGIRVVCPGPVLTELTVGQPVGLATSLVVREDSLTLFGFADAQQRHLFEVLQGVSGFGPRLALAILGALSADDLRRAVSTGDDAALMAVPGVGRKSAARLLIELGDKLGPPPGQVDLRLRSVRSVLGGSPPSQHRPVIDAMIGLGWSAPQAEAAVAAALAALAALPAEAEPAPDPGVGELLRLALRAIGRS